jgi:hypothetical protein
MAKDWREHRLGLDPALELLVEPFDRVGGARTQYPPRPAVARARTQIAHRFMRDVGDPDRRRGEPLPASAHHGDSS